MFEVIGLKVLSNITVIYLKYEYIYALFPKKYNKPRVQNEIIDLTRGKVKNTINVNKINNVYTEIIRLQA